jgi:DNA-binding CsgD family transcriptional regulator/tetratricopeptide (TPR) repeat protein
MIEHKPEVRPSIALVERDTVLQMLEDRLRSVATEMGHTALIAGEAGIGKTSLLKTLAARRGQAQLWWGECDALQTPHPLAPLHDIARSCDVPFRSLLWSDGSRPELFESVLGELQQSRHPRLVVIEDAHWADDATLDLVKFLGRRIDRTACLLAISYRDDELESAHPFRRVLGELPGGLVTKIDLPRLTPAGVDLLARRSMRSAEGIYSATHGNPFFVSELLRHGSDGVPRSVQDLVLARFARLSAGAQAIVRLASVVPARIERWLVEALLDVNVALIDECLNSGLLSSTDSALQFRHELARVAIETSLSEPAARALHASVLSALPRDDRMGISLARLVHHATRAGDGAAVRRYAPEAAWQAEQRGAHHEAAAHYFTALEHASEASDSERAGWLDSYACESHIIDRLDEAIAVRFRLDELQRRAGNVLGEADNLSQLALDYVVALRNREADATNHRAIEILETLPPGEELASAYRIEAQLRMLARDCEASIAWSTKAIRLAEQFGNRRILAAATSTLGTAKMFTDYEQGCAHLRRALELGLEDGAHYVVANVYSNLGSVSGEVFRLREAHRYLEQAIAFANRYEIDFYRNYATAWLALCEMYLGSWDDAAEHALDIIQQSAHSGSRVMALTALGRLQARRGEPGATATLDEALQLAIDSDTLQRLGPVRSARAEAAYLRNDLAAVIAEAEPGLLLATSRDHPWFAGDFAYWLQRAGALDATPTVCAAPFALQIAGRAREAAAAWAALGCPYEQARALDEGDVQDQLEALALFEQLGARPAAQRVRRRLRTCGIRGVPRGTRTSTQANPHGLTARELEVVVLLCDGLKNSEIAERLCRSVRTVDSHLAGAFSKLGVSSRTEAVAFALRSGIRPQIR